jgi:hypothetical protein
MNNNYNVSIATTTSYSSDGTTIGYTVKETTYNYLDFVSLCLKFGMGFFIIYTVVFKIRKK